MEGMEGLFDVAAELLELSVEAAAEGNSRCACAFLAFFVSLVGIAALVYFYGGS